MAHELLATLKQFIFLACSSCVVCESLEGYATIGSAKSCAFLWGKNGSGEVVNPASIVCIRASCRLCLFLPCEFTWEEARVLWKMSPLAWELVPQALTHSDI